MFFFHNIKSSKDELLHLFPFFKFITLLDNETWNIFKFVGNNILHTDPESLKQTTVPIDKTHEAFGYLLKLLKLI